VKEREESFGFELSASRERRADRRSALSSEGSFIGSFIASWYCIPLMFYEYQHIP
jgi:hypothetical protein